jgi:putative Mg2+ transporter-C (MgtC) family protein
MPQPILDFLHGPSAAVLWSTLERLVVALILGGIIGLERELRHRPAGLRTNMLICFGAAMYTVLSIELANKFGGDKVRIASQIITGIGFIGAGAILRGNGSVSGLTTASTIFVAASIGMAAGGGFYSVAVFATVVVLVALTVLGRLERHFEYKREVLTYEVVGPSAEVVLEELHSIAQKQHLEIRDVHAAAGDRTSRIVFSVSGLPPDGDKALTMALHRSTIFSAVQLLGRGLQE